MFIALIAAVFVFAAAGDQASAQTSTQVCDQGCESERLTKLKARDPKSEAKEAARIGDFRLAASRSRIPDADWQLAEVSCKPWPFAMVGKFSNEWAESYTEVYARAVSNFFGAYNEALVHDQRFPYGDVCGVERRYRGKVTTASQAVRSGDISKLNAVLAKGVKLDEFDSLNQTPLLWALRRGDARMAVALFQAGADPNLTFAFGQASPVALALALRDNKLSKVVWDALEERGGLVAGGDTHLCDAMRPREKRVFTLEPQPIDPKDPEPSRDRYCTWQGLLAGQRAFDLVDQLRSAERGYYDDYEAQQEITSVFWRAVHDGDLEAIERLGRWATDDPAARFDVTGRPELSKLVRAGRARPITQGDTQLLPPKQPPVRRSSGYEDLAGVEVF